MISSENIRKMNKRIKRIEAVDRAVQFYDKRIRERENIPLSDNAWRIFHLLDRDRLTREALQLYITQK